MPFLRTRNSLWLIAAAAAAANVAATGYAVSLLANTEIYAIGWASLFGGFLILAAISAGLVLEWRGRTGQRAAERELRDARFLSLAEALPQKVWTGSPTGEIEYFNRRWIEHTGISAANATEGRWREAIHPNDRDVAAEAWREAVATGYKFDMELRLREGATGEYRWHLANAAPVRNRRGRVVQWIGTLTDIHDQKLQAETLEQLVNERTDALHVTNLTLQSEIDERRRAQERELAAATELRRSNEELEKFAYVASHDLQEPLRKIEAFGDRLHARCHEALGEQGREYLDRMLRSTGRMRVLIDDLLTFARVSTKPQSIAPVDLNALVSGVLSDLEERIALSDAAIHVGPLPTLEANPLQMRQLFQNLIGNALKFRKPGAAARVTVRAEPDTSGWRIEIADNGIGFDENYVDRIFQVFQRLHGRGDYEGTGIGLAVARKIVERHGGTITAQSEPNKGSTFIVTLPARQRERGACADVGETNHHLDGGRRSGRPADDQGCLR